MDFLQYDLGRQSRGAVAVTELSNQANVRLMTASNFNAFKSGRQHRYHGGRATRSPVRLRIPADGHWFVVVDLGGLSGKVRASVRVEAPPPGLLPPIPHEDAIRNVQIRTPQEPEGDVLGGQTWDVFISHSSADKDTVAVPLRDALVSLGVSVWLDKTELSVGDSLRRKIDQGIRSSRFGVVVLSLSFFSRGWTNLELDGLVTRNVSGKQTLLPIWHDLTADEVRAYSPTLADKVALSTRNLSIGEMAEQIAAVVRGDA